MNHNTNNTPKIRLGLDLDGVIYNHADEFRELVAKERGCDIEELPVPKTWSFYRDWGMTDEEFYFQLGKAAIRGQVFQKGKIYPEALESVTTLKDMGFEIVIITARQLSNNPEHMRIIRENTETWLLNNNVPYDELVIDNDKTRHSLNILVDDSITNIEAMIMTGNYAYIFDQPWNRQANLYPRVTGWADTIREMSIVQEQLMQEYEDFLSSDTGY